MFILCANKNCLRVRQREPVTSGSVKVYRVRFEFSPDWDGMERAAVFRAGTESRSILLDGSNTCDVPWEVLVKPNILLQLGVYGTRGGEEVLPTIWADLGTILPGVAVGQEAKPPTPDLWQQELAQKQDKLHGLPGQVVGFDEDGNAIPQDAPSGGGGSVDHRALSHRDAGEQHPIESITGLKEMLNKTLTAGNVLSVSEILKIMEA